MARGRKKGQETPQVLGDDQNGGGRVMEQQRRSGRPKSKIIEMDDSDSGSGGDQKLNKRGPKRRRKVIKEDGSSSKAKVEETDDQNPISPEGISIPGGSYQFRKRRIVNKPEVHKINKRDSKVTPSI